MDYKWSGVDLMPTHPVKALLPTYHAIVIPVVRHSVFIGYMGPVQVNEHNVRQVGVSTAILFINEI